MVFWILFAGRFPDAGSVVSVALGAAEPFERLRARVVRVAFWLGFAFTPFLPLALFPRVDLSDRAAAFEATARRPGFEPRDDFALAVLEALRDGIGQLA
jgi:hypothetical protein